MMKRVYAYSAPRGGAGFGLTGRPVPRPFSVLIPLRPADYFSHPRPANPRKCWIPPLERSRDRLIEVNEWGDQEYSLYQALAVFLTLFMQNSG